MEWLRFYTRTLDCRKVQALDPLIFKYWVNLLCIASIHGGILPAVSEISFRLRCSPEDATAAIKKLQSAELIDVSDGEYVMHDWKQHQYVSDNSTERVKKHRMKQERNVSVTPPEQNRTETDAEQREKTIAPTGAGESALRPAVPAKPKSKTLEDARRALGVRLPWFEHFCSVHPAGKEGVKAAAEAFARKVSADEAGHALALEMYRGAKAYRERCAADPTVRVKWMQGWINDERWRDAHVVAPAIPMPTASERRRSEVIHGLDAIDKLKGRA